MASLEDRITKPGGGQGNEDAPDTSAAAPDTSAAATEKAEATSWADEASSAADASSAPPSVKADAEKEMSSLAGAQTDGATFVTGGTDDGVVEPSYSVDIKLADLQADPNDPLYSAKTFEQLEL